MTVRSVEVELGVGAALPRARRRGFFERHQSRIRALGSIVVVFALWELIGRFVITNRLFFVRTLSEEQFEVLPWKESEAGDAVP